MKNQILNADISLNFNPFGGLKQDEILSAIVTDQEFEKVFLPEDIEDVF